jgi:hypothetical protein
MFRKNVTQGVVCIAAAERKCVGILIFAELDDRHEKFRGQVVESHGGRRSGRTRVPPVILASSGVAPKPSTKRDCCTPLPLGSVAAQALWHKVRKYRCDTGVKRIWICAPRDSHSTSRCRTVGSKSSKVPRMRLAVGGVGESKAIMLPRAAECVHASSVTIAHSNFAGQLRARRVLLCSRGVTQKQQEVNRNAGF